MKKIFISYSWDNEEHKSWVRKLADELEAYIEISVTFDQYDLDTTIDKNYFMEKGAFESDFIILIMTPSYVERANNRMGGVGIESYMISARYWEEMLLNKKTVLVPIMRIGKTQGTPNYLKGSIFIDFRDDEKYQEKLINLLDTIKGTNLVKRPEKTKSLSSIPKDLSFTRCEDLIKINYKRRKLVFDLEQSRDFSGKSKIRFELWETASPHISHHLFLFENINIKETISYLSTLLRDNRVTLKNLTVLRNKKGDTSYLERLFQANEIKATLTEMSFSDYIWNYCIDETIKEPEDIFQNPLFIDQDIISYNSEDEDYKNEGPATDKLFEILTSESQSPIKIITAAGGTGKTTLCHNLFKKLSQTNETIPILIQSEAIRSLENEALRESINISNVFDLYQAYSKLSKLENEDNKFSDKNTFELALLAGKLVLIIDGMDEFISLFPQNFKTEEFIDSIKNLNKELGSSKILITTRNDIFDEQSLLEYKEIEKFKLLGFDKETCEKYLLKRFKKYPNPKKYSDNVLQLLEPISRLENNDDRILPFIIDLFSSQVEENIGNSKPISFDKFKEEREYECNNEVIDYLVYSVINRELIRQDINLKIKDIILFFNEMASYQSDKFSRAEAEEYFGIAHNDIDKTIASKVLINPLIDSLNKNEFGYKYDFLTSYFKSLYLINQIILESCSKHFLKLMSQNAFGDSEIFSGVSKYFMERDGIFLKSANKICKTLSSIKHGDNKIEVENIRKSIGFLINITSTLLSSKHSKESFTRNLKELLSVTDKFENLGIYGLSSSIDFSDSSIWNSKFVQFSGFTKSNFSNAKFIYCTFERTPSEPVPPSFSTDMFDNCILGDLQNVIEEKTTQENNNKEIIKEEIRKFLSSFYHNGKFKDQKIEYVKMSDKVKSINQNFFNKLIKNGIIELKESKSSADYFIISEKLKPSTYNFITNGIANSEIESIIALLD